MKKILLFFVVVFITNNFIAKAQTKKVLADKIIGQVGDRIILRSDIINAIADYKRQGQDLPPNAECSFLQGQLIQKALVLQAERDSLPISDDDVEARLDNQIRGFIANYGSKDALEEIAGRSIYQIKEDFRQYWKENLMAEKMQNKILENIKITPTEAKAFFDRIPKDSLPFYESELEISQIISEPKANKDVDDYVIKQLYNYKRQVEKGEIKFEQLSKLYSDDKGTENQGGTLAINRGDKGMIDKDFLSAAFRLKEGQISPVIKSKFGYHIIYMVSRAGDDAVVRHILKVPPVTDEEVKLSIAKLDSVRTKILNKEISFGEAVDKYSDDESAKMTGGQMLNREGSSYNPIDFFDKDIVKLLNEGLKQGDISKPQVHVDEQGKKTVRLIYLKTRTDAHRMNFKDDYNKIAQLALDEKKQKVLHDWFNEHLSNYYIYIDQEFTGCKNLEEWWKYTSDTK